MPTTTNKSYSTPAHGAGVGTWDTDLNTVFSNIDLGLGGTLTVYSSNGSISLTSSQAYNLAYLVTGTLTGNLAITFTSSLGGNGIYVVDNQSSGAFAVTVTQTSTGATPLTIPQGGRSLIYGNGTTFNFADNNQTAKLYSYLGSPQGNVAGTAATANGGATDEVRDVTNQIDYATKTTGSSSTAIWIPKSGLPAVGGYLTASTDADNPVPSGDLTGVAQVFWTPMTSNWCWASDGTAVFPVQFSRTTLTLTNTNNAASQIQDVFYFWNGGTPVIGTGPTWAAGAGGSVTAGACARGTGAGGAALTRTAGVWTNAVAMTINNGGTSYVMAAGEGVYLGSLFIDASAGQVTCHRTWGQSRKWGVWSSPNRADVILKAGDSTGTWSYGTGTVRASNGNTANSLTIFSGLAEEIYDLSFQQSFSNSGGAANELGIGFNSVTAFSGKIGRGINTGAQDMVAELISPPSLGINTVTSLEKGGGGTTTWNGTNAYMELAARWRA